MYIFLSNLSKEGTQPRTNFPKNNISLNKDLITAYISDT